MKIWCQPETRPRVRFDLAVAIPAPVDFRRNVTATVVQTISHLLFADLLHGTQRHCCQRGCVAALGMTGREKRAHACVPPSSLSSPRIHGPVASMSGLSKSTNQGYYRRCWNSVALELAERAGCKVHLRRMGPAAADAIAPWLAAWHGIGWVTLGKEFCKICIYM